MLAHLAPARRRMLIVLIGLLVGVLVAGGVSWWLGRDQPVDPVSQSELGPVLILPGYGNDADDVAPLAEALRGAGREVEVIPGPDGGRGDLRGQAELAAEAAQRAVDDGAPSVDVLGYSAGGVAARWFVAELGGDALTRRVLTLASPHHGTDLVRTLGGFGGDTCPEGCRQLDPDSELLARLNRDETPAGPQWIATWTTDDQTVVPPTSGRLDGAIDFSLQSVCPGLRVSHGDIPSDPSVAAIAIAELGTRPAGVPGAGVCA